MGMSLSDESQSESLLDIVDRMIEARLERSVLFSASLFSDPAWDILLYLMRAELMQIRISFTRLSHGTGVPPSTAHRWIAALVDRRMLLQRGDPRDARRLFIELHPEASAALRKFLRSFAGVPLV
jgi:DNA-binding MarR family transcriptional regulator